VTKVEIGLLENEEMAAVITEPWRQIPVPNKPIDRRNEMSNPRQEIGDFE